MRVYLDTNVIERPFDDLTDQRIHNEAAAAIEIFMLALTNVLDVIISDIVLAEIMLTKDLLKRDKVESLIVEISKDIISLTEDGKELGRKISTDCGIKDLADCFHISSAAKGNCRFFISCDDELLRKRIKIEPLLNNEGYELLIRNPIELIEEWR